MVDLSTTYLGLKLKNPVIAGSSGLTNSLGTIKTLADNGAGAIVLKSIFEEQILAETNQQVQAAHIEDHPEAYDYINRMAQEHSIDRYLNLIDQAKNSVNVPVIASVNCLTGGDWVTFAKRLEAAGADALELNILLTDFWQNDSQAIEAQYLNIVKKVKSVLKIPLSIKISSLFSNIPQTALDLTKAGASGLVLFNRYWSPDIDLKSLTITGGNIFSTPEEASLPIRWIALLNDSGVCDLCASTGIHDGYSAAKCLLVGAKAVQVCSSLYKNGMEQLGTIISELEDWAAKRGYSSLEAFQGTLAPCSPAEKRLFGRSQFMKYYSSGE